MNLAPPILARARRWCLAAVLAAVLGGCASGPQANPADPLEPFNRSMFAFNDALDRHVLKPVATTYHDAVPHPLRRGVGNFFANLQDVWSLVNNVLQLKVEAAADSFGRVLINTTIGLGGIFDVASEAGIARHTEDFGQTLGRWGVGAGPYVVLPFFGPSTVRDTAALPVDWRGDLVVQQDDVALRNTLWALRTVDGRAQLLKAGQVLEDVALDKYTFTRDAYLQRRRSAIYDGNPPDETPAPDDAADEAAPAPAPVPAR